jgi:hypothetical protein
MDLCRKLALEKDRLGQGLGSAVVDWGSRRIVAEAVVCNLVGRLGMAGSELVALLAAVVLVALAGSAVMFPVVEELLGFVDDVVLLADLAEVDQESAADLSSKGVAQSG